MDANELRYQIARSGLQKKSIAKLMGIGEVTLHRKIKGTADWRLEEVKKLKKILELNDATVRAIFFAEKVS